MGFSWPSTISDEANVAICVVTIALAITITTKLANMRGGDSFSSDHLACAKSLVSQAIEWHHHSQQDENALFAARHADYALAYMNAARRLVPDETLQKISSIDVFETMVALEAHQQKHTRRLQRACPTINPGKTTSSVSWLNSA